MPRYMVAGCCNNRGHVANRLEPYFAEELKIQLEGYRRHLREFLFTAGRKNIKIYDPSIDLKNFTMEQTWGDDPIHPTREVISKMADTLITMVDNVDSSSGGGGGTTEGRDGRDGREGRGPSFRQDSIHSGQRNRWPGPRRGGGFHPYNFDSDNSGGRNNPPGYPRGGRDGRGGRYRGRARPY
jgi:hypothetical protein